MSNGHPLDRFLTDTYPELADETAVRELEQIPYDERIAVESTYEALHAGAALNPDLPAIHFLQTGEPDEAPLTLTYRQWMGRVTQTANLLHDLGVRPGDVVSFMLPLLPQSFMVLFGAEAAGIVNPVNPMLEVGQIAGIMKAAGTKVLVTLGPMPGADIWEKSHQVRKLVPGLDTVLQVLGAGDERDGVYPFDVLLDRYTADRLISGRRIDRTELAAYFHTGGTTGLPKLVRHTHRNQVSQAWGVTLMFRSEPQAAILYGLPLFHVGGALTQGWRAASRS
jgi:fatty-acyl-CoA synthase